MREPETLLPCSAAFVELIKAKFLVQIASRSWGIL